MANTKTPHSTHMSLFFPIFKWTTCK